MKPKMFLTILTLLGLMMVMTPGPQLAAQERLPPREEAGPVSGGGLGTPLFRFDKEAFESGLRLRIGAHAMGYSVVLIKDGQYVTDVTGGYARNATDGLLQMSWDIPSNIGSSIKFVTGVTVLRHFEQVALKGGPTVDQQLDTEIEHAMPMAWKMAADASVKKLTYRQLMRHKSGFSTADGIGDEAQSYKFHDWLTNPTQRPPGTREYQNINFMLLGYLIPGLVDPGFVAGLDQTVGALKIPADSPYIRHMLGTRFIKHMRDNIYGAITPQINPSCNAAADYLNKPVALMYSSPADETSGEIWSSYPQDNENHCRGQGGWYMSAKEFAIFVANFATDKLISKELREEMFNPSSRDDRMVWSSSTAYDDWYQTTFGQGRFPFHGGDHPVGDGEAHATVVRLPLNYYAVAVTNSGTMNSRALTANILAAFRWAAAE